MDNLVLALCYHLPSRFRVLIVNAGIAKMSELVPDFVGVIVLTCEAAVWLPVHPDYQWTDA